MKPLITWLRLANILTSNLEMNFRDQYREKLGVTDETGKLHPFKELIEIWNKKSDDTYKMLSNDE